MSDGCDHWPGASISATMGPMSTDDMNGGTATRTFDCNLAARFERHGDETAIIAGAGPSERTIGYPELVARIGRWRGGLVAAGVTPGDRVAIVAGNTIEFVLVHAAAMGIGAISVPLNPQSPPAELQRELEAVAPAAIFVGPEGEPAFAATDRDFVARRLSQDGLESAEPAEIVAVSADTPAVLVFTSGTAGPPKPAILTHGSLTASLQAVLSLPVDLVGGAHRFLAVLPLFHVFGLNTILHLALLIGAAVVLDDYRSPTDTVDRIRWSGATVVAGPPTLWAAIHRLPTIEAADLSSVRLAVSGAAKLPPQLRIDIQNRFGLELHEGYGLTESSAVLASSISTDAPLGSVGRLLPGVEARIVDHAEEDCFVGDPGDLWVRGPMIFGGYWNGDGPMAGDQAVTADGWLKTGDVAVVDEHGFLTIVDRRKDLVIVSGFNVFPAEVEGVLSSHPDVAQVAIVGEPSETTGEAVVAFVVPEHGTTITEDGLQELCERELARYKVPSRFVIASGLPVGPTGKLQRNRLR